MAKGYRPVNRDQPFLLPPDVRDWLPAEHPVHLVIRVVGEHLDTSAFHAARRTGGAGAAGYDPDMLVTVLVWAYANGVTSSRRIEELCRTDVAFMVICGLDVPDHVTIARFRAGFPAAVAALFGQVLALCARLGMGRLGTVALDGTKIAASASMEANRAEDALRKLAEEAVARHGGTDAAEDGLFGGARGDEVPADAWSPQRRDERIAAALAGLAAEREAAGQAEAARADRYRARRAAGQRAGRPPARAEVAAAEENLARARAARAAQLAGLEERYAAGQPRRGRRAGIDDYCRVRDAAGRAEQARARAARQPASEPASEPAKEKGKGKGRVPVRNITDPDSRLMPVRGGGFIQGYNAQNVTSADGLIIATELTCDPADTAWFAPMLAAAADAAALITAARPAPASDGRDAMQDVPGPGGDVLDVQDPGGDVPDPGADVPAGYHPGGGYAGPIGLFLADAGYCSEDNIKTPGPPRLIATARRANLEKAARGQRGRPDRGGPHTKAMTARLKTAAGIAAYRQRGHIAETPHGHIKHNMGLRQLSMRGKTKASAEWTFACAVHNLLKALSAGCLTSQALAALAT